MKQTIALIAGLASATLLMLAAPAQAGPVHVDLNIGIPLPMLVQSQPVYAQQYQPAYVQSGSVYVQQRPDYGYRYGDYWAQRQRAEHEWREHHEWHDHDREWHDHDYRDYRRD